MNTMYLAVAIFVALVLASIALALVVTLNTGFPSGTTLTINLSIENTSIVLEPVSHLEFIVVVDNNPGQGIRGAWGLSILVRADNYTLLFDTGPSSEVLSMNMDLLGINASEIDAVVISHEHMDHIGGLGYILKAKPGVKVYLPAGASNVLKKRIRRMGGDLVEVNDTTVIGKGVAIVGQLFGPPWEQALAVNVRDRGIVLFVGCSHSGILKFLDKVEKDLGVQVYLIVGGLHIIGRSTEYCYTLIDKIISRGVKLIAPLHCSGNTIREILKEDYPEYYLGLHTGSIVRLG